MAPIAAKNKNAGELKRLTARERSEAISIELRRVARKARVPRPVSSGGGGFRARRSDKIFRWYLIGSFSLLFVIPAVLSILYYSFIAADQYVSEARFAVKSADRGAVDALAGLTTLFGGQSGDAAIIAEYIQSRAVIDELSSKFDLRRIFSPGTYDYFAELKAGATMEDLLEYWERQVSVTIDRSSGLMTLRVKAFSADESLKLAAEIIVRSEQMVNKLTGRNQINALAEASAELERSKSTLVGAVVAMRDARNAAGIIDADTSAKAQSEILTALSLEEAKVNVQIATLTKGSAEAGPQLTALRARSASLREEIDRYQKRLASEEFSQGSGAEESLADRTAVLAQTALELKIAQSDYARTSTAYELARMNNERQKSYLLTYVQPRRAEEALYPKRLLMSVSICVVAFIAWAIAAGVALLVRDHTA
ncbi:MULTISPECIES: hypothetical protein [unclassified Ensifer]|uniref:hypothetical protein n=1 Tax=unclassified Ensifer TaxID=2633371 RepID=UPI000812CF07|nr:MULTISPECIES: hypothetical protein [unclassified Ensifer]OCP10161.1 hypothetical protein BC362_08275 [Ensifer sp. LC14]OCP12176.1 hypothetical protein BC374_15170 [Ensifer sp. LC13]OCP12994.1 hypothetical protein BBX50_14945 [Ensifer sp. LC11]OCP33738.1 hypothetical protein BC364_14260 [Ensifer sp. LC499]